MEKDEYEIRQGGNCVCGRAKADVGYLKDWHYDIMFVLSKQQPVSLRRPFDWNRVGVDPIVIIKDDGGVPDPIE